MAVAPGEVALVPTGLVIEVPAGHFLGIFARSSTPLKRGLMVANGVGVVDSDYCGPTTRSKFEVLNFTDRAGRVRRGDRLAQGIIMPFVRARVEGTGRARTADARRLRRDGHVARTRVQRGLTVSILLMKNSPPPPLVATGATVHDSRRWPTTTARPTAMPRAEPKTTSLTQCELSRKRAQPMNPLIA